MCLINKGKDSGAHVVIVDVIDQNYVLVDGPAGVNGVRRQKLNLKSLTLTDLVIPGVLRGMRHRLLKKNFEKADPMAKFNESKWGKTIAQRNARKELSDFERFKLAKARQHRDRIAKAKFAQMKA